jgi:biotin carboxyl carrier protein
MKKYRVNVNGTDYEIELEVMEPGAAPAPKKAAPKAEAPKAEAAPAASAASAGAGAIKSPMPGTILSVNVSVGDSVKKGQVLMILEAMKMENEIMAPADGKVTAVYVANGASVESGTPLCELA